MCSWKSKKKTMDILYTVLVFFLASGSGVDGLYFPLRRMHFWFRVGSVPKNMTELNALLYSGRRAPAIYTMSRETTSDVDYYLDVSSNGILSWKAPIKAPINLTATIDASYKGHKAETEVHVTVLPALLDPCKLPFEEICFSGGDVNEFLLYEDTKIPVKLDDFKPSRLPCKQERPKYSLRTRKGGDSKAARLRDGQLLEVIPTLAKGDFQLNITCSRGKDSLDRQVKVQLMPARVKLPYKPTSLCRRLVSNVTQGSHILLTWAIVKQGSTVILGEQKKSLPYFLRLSKYNFTTDFVNATLVLVNLTWSRTERNLTDIRVPVVLNCSSQAAENGMGCSKDSNNCLQHPTSVLMEISCEVVVARRKEVRYPEDRLRVIASPFARIAQPAGDKNVTGDAFPFEFQSALPELLESPFDVTRTGGIVYLTDWSVHAISHTSTSPGMLVEWLEDQRPLKSGVGLAWLDITVVATNCSDWSMCAEARSEKTCIRPCRIAATPLQKGRCEWRENKDVEMTRKYATCSSDLDYCPDKVCDPLEELHPGICSQDCTTHVSLGVLGEPVGIGSGKGICTCDSTGTCHCGVNVGDNKSMSGKGVKKKPQPDQKRNTEEHELQEQPLEPPKLTAIEDVKKDELICDIKCVGLIVCLGAGISFIFVALIYISTLRSCTVRKKGREGLEYSAHALLPINSTENRTTTPVAETLIHHHEIDPKWEVSRTKLIVEECLGEGEFGRVLKATARDLPNNPGYTTVAVKTLKNNAGTSELEDLMSEYQLLKEVSHPNVIKLLGACTTPGGPVYIIIEFCALGSLRAYLRRHRNIRTATDILSFQNNDSEITPHDILSCAWQISKGMAYLTEIKLVHRDLAARNILLATGKICKISDFGLTRDVYEDDTYLKKSRGRVPVKWMALESLSDHVYTSKSDVWSFGIVLWELVTLGSSPYPGVAVQNLYHLLKTGYRMQKPGNCSDQLYEIMKECWSANPSDRPSFANLVHKFESMLEDGADYLDCNIHMVSNPSYFANVDERVSGPPGEHEMDITFKMDFDDDEENTETDMPRYENESINKNTSYDMPKPISSIIMSDIILKDEQR